MLGASLDLQFCFLFIVFCLTSGSGSLPGSLEGFSGPHSWMAVALLKVPRLETKEKIKTLDYKLGSIRNMKTLENKSTSKRVQRG